MPHPVVSPIMERRKQLSEMERAVIMQTCEAYEITEDDLLTGGSERHLTEARVTAAYSMYALGQTPTLIARKVGRERSMIYYYLEVVGHPSHSEAKKVADRIIAKISAAN